MHFGVLRDRRFAKMFAGQTISELGSAVTQIALPTIAVLVLHAGSFQLGILIALQRIPFPILALLVGVWVDRLPRRRVMIVADILRAVALAAVPIGAAAGFLGLPLLYSVALASGVLTIFFDLAYLSYVPELVGRDRLRDANSVIQVSISASNLAGPGLGGLLIQAVGAARAMSVDAASFVVSLLSLWWMGPDPARPPRAPSHGLVTELKEGLAHVFADPVLRTLILVFGLAIVTGHMSEPNLYPFAYRQLHLSPATLGWLLSAEGGAAVVGASLSPYVTRRLPAGWILACTGVVTGAAFMVISLAGTGPTVAILLAALVVNGLVDPINNVTQWSLRQLLTPDHLQGRMNSIFRTVFWGAWPIGNLIGGYVGSVIGSQASIFVAGAGFAIISTGFLYGPLRSAMVETKIDR
jgi:predicted MFS family arabinose efflux permease